MCVLKRDIVLVFSDNSREHDTVKVMISGHRNMYVLVRVYLVLLCKCQVRLQ